MLQKLVSPLPKLFESPTGSTAQSAINLVSSAKLYVRKTVSEILFDGYEDTILNKLKWPAKVIDVFRNPDEKIPRRFPGYMPVNIMHFFIHRTNFSERKGSLQSCSLFESIV